MNSDEGQRRKEKVLLSGAVNADHESQVTKKLPLLTVCKMIKADTAR